MKEVDYQINKYKTINSRLKVLELSPCGYPTSCFSSI